MLVVVVAAQGKTEVVVLTGLPPTGWFCFMQPLLLQLRPREQVEAQKPWTPSHHLEKLKQSRTLGQEAFWKQEAMFLAQVL